MSDYPSCQIAFSSSNGPKDAFLFFTRNVVIPNIFDAKMIGTPEQIEKITGDPKDEFVTIWGYNGQINCDSSGKTRGPHDSACQVGYLERDCVRYIRFEIDLNTGIGTIERIG
jgi:hypothetical protein